MAGEEAFEYWGELGRWLDSAVVVADIRSNTSLALLFSSPHLVTRRVVSNERFEPRTSFPLAFLSRSFLREFVYDKTSSEYLDPRLSSSELELSELSKSTGISLRLILSELLSMLDADVEWSPSRLALRPCSSSSLVLSCTFT